jgi:hypothetical protein
MIVAVVAVVTAATLPVMSRGLASASTATIKEDCTRGAPAMRSCDFHEVGFAKHVELAPQRVSPIVDNCGAETDVKEAFRYTVSVNRTITLEEGHEVSVTSAPFPLASSLFTIAQVRTTATYRLTTDGRTVSAAETLSGRIKADHRGFFMFAPLVGRSVGFLDALYQEEVDGETRHYFPGKDSSQVEVDFPELLQDGRPDGYMFIRNVPCKRQPLAQNASTADLSGLAETARFDQVPRFTDVLVDY